MPKYDFPEAMNPSGKTVDLGALAAAPNQDDWIDKALLELGDVFYQAGKQYGHQQTNMKECALKQAKKTIQLEIKRARYEEFMTIWPWLVPEQRNAFEFRRRELEATKGEEL